MKSDVERELKQLQEFIEAWERNRPPEDRGDDYPDSSVPAPVKPGPPGAIGAVALPDTDEDDTSVQQEKDFIARRKE